MTAPAPLDSAALEAVLRPFGQSKTLPGIAYTSQDVFTWDLIRFFEDAWVCVGREEELLPGRVAEIRVGTQSLVMSRTQEGRLLVFYNVCRHRGHEVLEPGASADVLRCPYHGWSYRPDGTLRAAPRFSGSLDPGEHGLTPVPTETWEGWVFVNLSGDALPLHDYLGNLVEVVAPYRPGDLVVGARVSYEAAANWKLFCENYHECYHCSSIHPELCVVSPPESGQNLAPTGAWMGGTMELRPGVQTMAFDGRSLVGLLPGLPPELTGVVGYYGVFPNLLISLHPDYVMTHRLEPRAPGLTAIECTFLFRRSVVEAPSFDPGYAVEFWDLVNRQDWKACESVQRGVASRGFLPGPLAPNEDAVYQFQAMVALAYKTGSLAAPPPAAVRQT